MSHLAHLVQTYGLLLIFGIVMLEQIGLPIPAFPVLIVAGALAVDGHANWALCLLASVLACLASDYFWFRAGRFYGKRILRLLCRISLSPDSCVNQTEDNFNRFGANSLVVAKFIPGFNTIAPPLAGAMGTATPRFILLSVAGALLWSGVGLGLGVAFHGSVDKVLAVFESMGTAAVQVVLALLGIFVAYKYVERRRLLRDRAIPRIAIDELRALIDGGHDPVIIDARGVTSRQLEAAIPGAVVFDNALMATLDKDRHIVVYCSCPNDVTAAQVAKQFLANGFHRARPLAGGLDAWNAFHGAQAAEPEPCGCGTASV
jgi:membrane protein DedA with SNARE-associated domain/rhodanese-related sulfurtransferase